MLRLNSINQPSMLMIFMLIKQSTFVNFSCQFKTKRELFAFHSDLYELDSSILQLAKYYKSVVYTSRDSASQTIHTSNFNNLCTIVRVNWPFEFVRDKQTRKPFENNSCNSKSYLIDV